MWAVFRKAGGSMSGEASPYKPSHWPQENVLSTELRRHGKRVAAERLAKACKGAFPATRSAAEHSKIWMWYKGWRTKKAKLATAIMALEYDGMVEEVDKMVQLVQQLQVRVRSQDEEEASLRKQLQVNVQQKKQLKDDLKVAQTSQRRIEAEMWSKDDEVETLQEEEASLRKQLQVNVQQKKQLKDDLKVAQTSQRRIEAEMWSKDDEVETLQEEVASLRKQLLNQVQQKQQLIVAQTNKQRIKDRSLNLSENIRLLNSLPDLEKNNYNYEFWKKITKFCIMGANAEQICRLVLAKCPKDAWQKIERSMSDLCLLQPSSPPALQPSSPSDGEAQLQIIRRTVSRALGSGMEHYYLYKHRRQKEDESFESYSTEKFKLYCAHGTGDKEPDINDEDFLNDLQENAHKKYRDLGPYQITTYADMMSRVTLKDNLLLARKWKNKCENCENYGHDWDSCRRPGGGDEAPPGVCYTCGMPGHLARNCWHYG